MYIPLLVRKIKYAMIALLGAGVFLMLFAGMAMADNTVGGATLGFVASCISTPESVAPGKNAVFAGGQSGGTGVVQYSWVGAVHGNGQVQNAMFASWGTKVAWLRVTDEQNRLAVATCSLRVTPLAASAMGATPASNTSGGRMTGGTRENIAPAKLALAVEIEGDIDEAALKSDSAAHKQSLLASVIPASIRAISFSTAYLLFLTLVMFGIVAYLVVTRKKTSQLV